LPVNLVLHMWNIRHHHRRRAPSHLLNCAPSRRLHLLCSILHLT
jgi:hypothetical protein